jgi:hypothetical protein
MKRLCIAVLLAFATGPAMAETIVTGEQAIPITLKLVETLSKYKNIPPVRFWVELSADRMGAQAIKFGMAGDHRQIAAIYSCAFHTMYTRQGWNYDDPGPLSALVHELTHHAQCEAHVPMVDACPVEREAYAVQAAFVRSLPDMMAKRGRTLTEEQRAKVEAAAKAIEATADQACAVLRNR